MRDARPANARADMGIIYLMAGVVVIVVFIGINEIMP